MFERLRPTGEQAGAGARGMVIAKGVDSGAAAVPVRTTSVRGDWQGQSQPPTQSEEHAVGRQGGASLAGDGAEPCGSMRPGLRTQHGLCRGRQGGQQLGLAKVG